MAVVHPLDKDIGQLSLVGFQGTLPEDSEVVKIRELIAKEEICGVVLFRHNITSSEQLLELTSSLKEASKGLPPFIAVDQEGGKVQRLRSSNGFSDYPSAFNVAANSETNAYEIYSNMAKELALHNINWNFAPCVDLLSVNNLPPCPAIGSLERSFSSDPKIVSEYSKIFIKAMHDNKIVCCLKHFPGHGSSQGDTHKDVFDITNTWSESELMPFAEIINSGSAEAIMTAHLINNKSNDSMPATMSKYWMNILKQDLGFEGVVISDDLHMGAIQKHYSFDNIILNCINAGLDILLFSNNKLAAQGVEKFEPNVLISEKVREIALKSVEEGTISAEQISKSASKIRNLRETLT